MKKTNLKTIKSIFVLSIFGLIDAIYLALIKFLNKPEMCLPGVGDCWSVNTSSYSSIYGIPVSILGAMAYIALFLILFLEIKRPSLKNILIQLGFGITCAGFLFSIYLTYLEFFVIHAICPFCVISAVLMTVLFIIYIFRIKETM
jgi:uncharacterized membrane protein